MLKGNAGPWKNGCNDVIRDCNTICMNSKAKSEAQKKPHIWLFLTSKSLFLPLKSSFHVAFQCNATYSLLSTDSGVTATVETDIKSLCPEKYPFKQKRCIKKRDQTPVASQNFMTTSHHQPSKIYRHHNPVPLLGDTRIPSSGNKAKHNLGLYCYQPRAWQLLQQLLNPQCSTSLHS